MKILLDIDGVLETSPSWKKPEFEEDNFYRFNENSKANLIEIIDSLNPEIILTSTHRINYSLSEWTKIFQNRGFHISNISKINEAENISDLRSRVTEIEEWYKISQENDFLIIDDDNSLNQLSNNLKKHWIKIDSMLGITEENKNLIFNKFHKNNDRS